MKILTIIGARPQFIKAAPISIALKEAGINEFLLHTGQHYDSQMSNIFFQELGLTHPHLNLHIHGGTHGHQTARMLEAIEKILIREKPDRVLVYGDTNSTLAGALAAGKLHIPIDHVEAGLRSFNKKMPEELNRILTDHLSTLLFTPTKVATHNLMIEGFAKDQIKEVGDVMYDAISYFKPISEKIKDSVLNKLGVKEKAYYVVTIHRAENTESPEHLKKVFKAFNSLSKEASIIFLVHPRIKNIINTMEIISDNIIIIDPVGYLEMLVLINNSILVMTDSGGLQKESYFLKVPCITLRKETEWTELVASGWNTLTPINDEFLENLEASIKIVKTSPLPTVFPFYGHGDASQKITQFYRELS